MTAPFSEREQVVEVLNRLYTYTDARQWEALMKEVFAPEVWMDMTSLGASKAEALTAGRICDMWADGFKDLDAIHHQAGNYIIDIEGTQATAQAGSIATHYRKEATKGHTRTFVGTYDFKLEKLEGSWKITSFAYHLKYTEGNMDLE